MPLLFEPPPALLAAQSQGSFGSLADGTGVAANGNPQLWFVISGLSANPLWGGADIHASFDNATYLPIGTVDRPAKQGKLTAALAAPSGGNRDTIHTLAVDLAISGQSLPTATDNDAANSRSLCYVDGELIAYGAIAPVGATGYHLTDLCRGLFGSVAGAHANGSDFAFIDDSVFKYNLPAQYIGKSIYFKFRSFNVWGGGRQDLAALTPLTYVPGGTGIGFSNSSFMSLLYRGATLSLGDITGPVKDVFECGDIAGAVGEVLQLGSL